MSFEGGLALTQQPADPIGPHLRGYSLPFSPTGRSSLVAAPPWHFSGDVIHVEYLADPDAVRLFLPEPLRDSEVTGRVAATFGDWQCCTDDGEDLLEPVRAQHREIVIVMECRWRGRLVARCPMCWVDRDFSLVRGLIQGYPKKLGSIALTRSFGVGRAGVRLVAGARFAATLASGDRRLIDASVTLERPDSLPGLMTAPLVHTRHFPAWLPDGTDVVEHVMGDSVDHAAADIWSGPATLSFYDSPYDDLTLLAPVEVLRGYRFAFAETLRGGRPLVA